MEYSKECELGQLEAQHDMAAVSVTNNLPLLIRKIREAAADQTGYGVGYLYELGQRALK